MNTDGKYRQGDDIHRRLMYIPGCCGIVDEMKLTSDSQIDGDAFCPVSCVC